MLSITVDDLLLSYRNEIIQQNFYDHISAAFDITTPTDITRFKFLSLTIYQSEYGTSIDQTTHIATKILEHWFNNKHLPKIVNTPYPTNNNFELDLVTAPPFDKEELYLYTNLDTMGRLTIPLVNYSTSNNGQGKTSTMLSLGSHHLLDDRINQHSKPWNT